MFPSGQTVCFPGLGEAPNRVGEVLIVYPQDGPFWLAILTGTFPECGPGHNAGHRVYLEEDTAL